VGEVPILLFLSSDVTPGGVVGMTVVEPRLLEGAQGIDLSYGRDGFNRVEHAWDNAFSIGLVFLNASWAAWLRGSLSTQYPSRIFSQ